MLPAAARQSASKAGFAGNFADASGRMPGMAMQLINFIVDLCKMDYLSYIIAVCTHIEICVFAACCRQHKKSALIKKHIN